MCVVPLLAHRWIEKYDCAADKVNYLLVDKLGSLLILARLIAGGFGSELTHSVLKCTTDVIGSYAIYPFKFNFDIIGLSHVVMDSSILKSVCNQWLQGSI